MSEILTAPEPLKYLSLWKGEVLVTVPGPTMRSIAEHVAQRHGVTLEDLRGPSRVRDLVWPRQEAMWMMRQVRFPNGLQRYSYPRIGRFFGDRDHSTCIWGERQHEKRLEATNAA